MADGDIRELKERIEGISSIEHLTRAMGLVSTAKLRTSKVKLEKTRRHFQIVTDSIEEIFHNTVEIKSPYLEGTREIRKRGFIVISSSRGLCGSFNEKVIEKAQSAIGDKENSWIFAFGSKGAEFFKSQDYQMSAAYMGPPENISFLDAKMVCEPIIQMYNNEELDELNLIYTVFKSSLKQEPEVVRLLPFQPKTEKGDIPERVQLVDYEPSEETVFNYLVPKYVEIMLFKAIMESVVSENAARMMAMENATDNAQEIMEDLSMAYNLARQSAVTQEITEIIGGAEALS